MKKKATDMNSEYKAIIFNIKFDISKLSEPLNISGQLKEYVSSTAELIRQETKHLQKNGLVYIYGDPRIISLIGNRINEDEMDFKYWIAINSYAEYPNVKGIQPNHIGMLLYVNGESKIFDIDKESTRVPRFACPACGKNSKDWGGKKHLMNKKGIAISDVWNHMIDTESVYEDPEIPGIILHQSTNKSVLDIDGNTVPSKILETALNLAKAKDNYKIVDVERYELNFELENINYLDDKKTIAKFEKMNTVELADSIETMEKLVEKYPEGVFDLIFADPPYNLNKDYDNYDDDNSEKEYINWTKKWLLLSFKLLKKDGNLLYLNIPKWNIKTLDFLPEGSYYKDSIVWDSMSVPMGKIMPAHYSLLHITKSKNNYIDPAISNMRLYPYVNHCLRPSCIKNRKRDPQQLISNIWSDIHRIKHRRDRDYHPCQLPDKLLERIVSLYSKEGDLVFDPFNGVGTTAIWAKMLGRNYYSTDISQEYIDITMRKIKDIKHYGEIQKETIKRPKSSITKKYIEIFTQQLVSNDNSLKEEDRFIKYIMSNNLNFTVDDVNEKYGNVKNLLKKIRTT